ncbi:hypothetical protein [Bacillus sp. FJAT-45037]|uniref:hypothetical protein n=1 Tax=Bacillus sp. FJAT-45037 TaxID=2011007 RepID=UPI000C240C0E|nr:hypothetical protein [Bacillus sp. FJAT-45037]
MSHKKHNVCINAKKVFDWVIRPVSLTETFTNCEFFNGLTDICESVEGCFDPGFKVKCKVDCVKATDITKPGPRQKVEVQVNGEDVTLYKVKVHVSIKVFVFIKEDNCDEYEKLGPFELSSVETFYLCAPDGTFVYPAIHDGECEAEFFCVNGTPNLTINADFCLDVQVADYVKLEIEAAYCKPRDEFPISEMMVCRPDKEPKQCPHVFPGKHKC